MNTYYLIVNIIEDTTRETYRLFIPAASYREAVDKVMEQYFDEGGDAAELYNKLIKELRTDSFLSKMFNEEKSKAKKQTAKTEEN